MGFDRFREASLGLREGEGCHRQRLDRESSDRLQRESDYRGEEDRDVEKELQTTPQTMGEGGEGSSVIQRGSDEA